MDEEVTRDDVDVAPGGELDDVGGGCRHLLKAVSLRQMGPGVAGPVVLRANTLYISAISGDDTTLLVNGPDGRWYCDDDSYGDLDPIIAIPKAQSGLYDIWVGTYGEELVSVTLYISEVDPR